MAERLAHDHGRLITLENTIRRTGSRGSAASPNCNGRGLSTADAPRPLDGRATGRPPAVNRRAPRCWLRLPERVPGSGRSSSEPGTLIAIPRSRESPALSRARPWCRFDRDRFDPPTRRAPRPFLSHAFEKTATAARHPPGLSITREGEVPIDELFSEFAELVGRTMARRWIGRAKVAENRPSGQPILVPREITLAGPLSTNDPAESARTGRRRGIGDGEP